MSERDRAKWDGKYAERREPGEPSPWLAAFERFLPASGAALDVAGGAGRNALWLARRGLAVTLVDISGEALAIARAHAGALPLRTVALDLDTDPLPSGPWDVIACIAFLDRRVYRTFPSLLAPGGVLVVVHPTETNLERHASPPREYLLAPGDLGTFTDGLEVLVSDEGWSLEDRHL